MTVSSIFTFFAYHSPERERSWKIEFFTVAFSEFHKGYLYSKLACSRIKFFECFNLHNACRAKNILRARQRIFVDNYLSY